MTKLTLISIMCRQKIISTFLMLSVIDNKPVIYQSTIDKLFQNQFGFTPQRGETISFL